MIWRVMLREGQAEKLRVVRCDEVNAQLMMMLLER